MLYFELKKADGLMIIYECFCTKEKKSDMYINKKHEIQLKFVQLLYKYWLFFAAIILMAAYLKASGSMANKSGDAASIWETIKSFSNEKIIPSYVLYKGFVSVYPYVWFYQLSSLLNLNEFFFVKLFYCTLFAYISAVGFPYLIENLLNIKAKNWRKALLIIILFWLWHDNVAMTQLAVDLPSLACFLLLVNSALKIARQSKEHMYRRVIYTGILLGLNLCSSGQYTLSTIVVLLYILIKIVSYNITNKAKRFSSLVLVSILLMGMTAVYTYNNHFDRTVVDPLRAEGAWIPPGKTWLEIGFTRLMGVQRVGVGLTLPDNRGIVILKDVYGEQFEETYKDIIDGKIGFSVLEYMQLALKYPVDFLSRYINRLFLALTPDGGSPNISRLFASYTLIFCSFLSIYKRCKTVKQFFSTEIILVLSFLCAIAAPIVLTIELRYAMQIQGFIYAVGLLDDQLWTGLKNIGRFCKGIVIKPRQFIQKLIEVPLSYTPILYIVFVVFCFIHIATIYETVGSDTLNILFKF